MDEQKVREYFEKKDELERAKESLQFLREKFNDLHKHDIEFIDRTVIELQTLKDEVTEEAECEFITTNNKKLYGGIGIRESETIEYEPTKALEWSKKHDACLVLDKRAFEKLAKTNQFADMDCMVKIPKVTVTFPEKLKE